MKTLNELKESIIQMEKELELAREASKRPYLTDYEQGVSDGREEGMEEFIKIITERLKTLEMNNIEKMIDGFTTVNTRGEINLGTQNGWGERTNGYYDSLREHMIEGSNNSRKIGNCYYEYSFIVEADNGERYTVLSRVDSGG